MHIDQLSTARDNFTVMKKKLYFSSFIFIILSFVFTVLICKYQFKRSKEFYFWDNAGYENVVLKIEKSWEQESKADFLRHIYHSFEDEISYLFAIPLLPLRNFFGKDREGFLVSLAVCYVWTFSLLAGFLFSQTFTNKRTFAWVLGSSWVLLSSFAWIPTLDGRPDIGGGTLLLLAFWFYFTPNSEKGAFKSALIAGVCLATSCLFRRHYLLASCSFLLCALIAEWTCSKTSSKKQLTIRFLAALISYTGVLLTVGIHFTKRYIFGFFEVQRQFSSYLYAFSRNPLLLINSLVHYFSLPILALTIAGFVFALKNKVSRQNSIFFLIFITLWSFCWPYPLVFGHYAINILWVLLFGMALVFCPPNSNNKTSKLNLFVLLIAINALALFGLNPVKSFLFPQTYVPKVRQDYEIVLSLTHLLYSKVNKGDAILVPASSDVLNEGILMDADKVAGRGQRALNILGLLHMDSYQHIPIKEIIDAKWVTVTEPFQWHVAPQEQQTIAVLNNAFFEHWPISKDFVKEPEEFILEKGVKVSIYRRWRSTTEQVRLDTEQEMAKRILKR